MKYSVDRIENDIAILENLDTREIIEVNINELPMNIHDGITLLYDGTNYTIDREEHKSRIEMMREKMSRLKKEKE